MAAAPAAPDVSVVVPFFNAEPYLERCIRALLAQELPAGRCEILLVDNNSTDRGAEIVRRHPRVRLLRESRQGAYAARNRALAEARGSLIAFTDPDCEPRPDWLERLLAPLGDSAVQVVVGRSEPAGRSAALSLLSRYEHHKDLYVFGADDPRLYYGRTNNLATRRSTLEAYGPFVERRRGSDTIFVRRVTEGMGCRAVRYAPDARVLHLEIASLADYFGKIPLYGRSVAGFQHVIEKRGLNRQERALILRRTARDEAVPPLGVLPLLALLAAGEVLARVSKLTASRPEEAG